MLWHDPRKTMSPLKLGKVLKEYVYTDQDVNAEEGSTGCGDTSLIRLQYASNHVSSLPSTISTFLHKSAHPSPDSYSAETPTPS